MSITKFIITTIYLFFLSTFVVNAELSLKEEALIQNQIRDYILQNPEIIIESMQRYEQKRLNQAKKNDESLIIKNFNKLTNDKLSYSVGDHNSGLALVVFIDYKCGYCKKSLEELFELVTENPELRLIIKEFPILGAESLLASKASIALFLNQGPLIYEKFIKYLVKHRGEITGDKIIQIITSIGGDSSEFEKKMDEEVIYNVLNSNYALANSLKISGTPTFVIGTEVIRGYKEKKMLQALLDKNIKN